MAIPKDWTAAQLGNITLVSWGNTSLTKASYVSHGATAFSASGPDGFVERAEHNGNGIVLSAIGARCGRCFWASGSWTAIKNTITITAIGKADLGFMFQFLNRPGVWPSEGGAQPFIALGPARSLLVPVPPLPEQKKIAAVLSSVDAAIEKTEAVIAQLQVVKKAMMEQLLTKGMPGRHTRFKQTELGEIPEDWEVVSLGSVIDGIDAGWSPQCESRPAANGEWGVLKISSVTWGTFDPTENKKLPDHLVPRPNIAVHAGDVLLSRANTPELVGRTVVVEQSYSNLMLSDKLLRLRINRLVAEPRFINLVLGAPLWRELIQDAATGSSGSMKNLSQEKLRALPIPKPATKEQDAIANIFSAQDAVVRGEQLALDRLRTLKSSLSSSLLSGELRVPTDSVPCPV